MNPKVQQILQQFALGKTDGTLGCIFIVIRVHFCILLLAYFLLLSRTKRSKCWRLRLWRALGVVLRLAWLAYAGRDAPSFISHAK